MVATIKYTGTLAVETCCECHITFGMDSGFREEALRDHRISFYCPRGHSQHFIGETEEQKLRRQLSNSQDNATFWKDQHDAAERQRMAAVRSRAALKGVVTRYRNKIANGVCPVAGCRRHFDNVQAHIETQHPDWHITDPETGEQVSL